jgi:flagellar hook-length control protein FliK
MLPASTGNPVSTGNSAKADQQSAINQIVNLATNVTSQNDSQLAALVQQSTVTQPVAQAQSQAQSMADVSLPASVSNMLAAMSSSVVFSADQSGAAKKSAQTDNAFSNTVQSVQTASSVANTSALANQNTTNSPMVNALNSVSNASPVTQTNAESELTSLTQSFNAQSKSQQAVQSTDNMPINVMQPNQEAANTAHANSIPAMTLPISHPNWNAELADKLQLMHKQDISTVELQINPPHLGPISIKIGLDQQDQTTISFTTEHQQVKEAIEASIPKLREMLGGEQLSLLDVNVSQQQSDQKPAQNFFQMASDQGKSNNNTGSQNETENSTNSSAVDTVESSETGSAHVGNGLLNLFA